jgi:hypothetical protein
MEFGRVGGRMPGRAGLDRSEVKAVPDDLVARLTTTD